MMVKQYIVFEFITFCSMLLAFGAAGCAHNQVNTTRAPASKECESVHPSINATQKFNSEKNATEEEYDRKLNNGEVTIENFAFAPNEIPLGAYRIVGAMNCNEYKFPRHHYYTLIILQDAAGKNHHILDYILETFLQEVQKKKEFELSIQLNKKVFNSEHKEKMAFVHEHVQQYCKNFGRSAVILRDPEFVRGRTRGLYGVDFSPLDPSWYGGRSFYTAQGVLLRCE